MINMINQIMPFLLPLMLLGALFVLFIFNHLPAAIYVAGAFYQFTAIKEVSKYILLFAVIIFILRKLKEGKRPYIPKNFIWIFAFILFCMLNYFVSFLQARDLSLEWGMFLYSPYFIGMNNLIQLILSVAIMILVIDVINNRERLYKILKIMVISSTLVCLYAIIVYIAKVIGIEGAWQNLIVIQSYYVPRLYGTAVEPLAFANQILVTLPLSLVAVMSASNDIIGMKKATWFVCFFIQAFALLLTFSLGGFFAFFVALLFILIMHSNKNVVFLMTVLLAIMLFLSGAFSGELRNKAIEYFANRIPFLSTSRGLARDRASMNAAAINMFLNNPVNGVGYGNFAYLYKYYAPPDGISIDTAKWKANNDWLTLLAETGLIGTFLYVSFIFSICWFAIKAVVRINHTVDHSIIFGLTASSIAVLFQSLFGYFIQAGYLWLLLGLLIAASKVLKSNENSH